MFALERLKEKRALAREQHFFIGRNYKKTSTEGALAVAVGKCAVNNFRADIEIQGCAPTAGTIYRKALAALGKK